MDVVLLMIAVIAAFHVYTYARWLKENNNKAGACGIYVLIIIGLVLPAYRLLRTLL